LFTLQDLKQEGKTTLFNLSWECVHSWLKIFAALNIAMNV
jgi:hypothetical protein